jgi:branched-chain amino acid transport system ATP-binding protein
MSQQSREPITPTGTTRAPALLLEGVHTHIGAYHILHGVDLEVPQGSVTLLLGRNGAGKTTTLRTVMGLWHASAGRILLAGDDITRLATPAIARKRVGYVPETMGIFSDLTVAENMTLAARHAARTASIDSSRLEWIFSMFPALKKFWHHPAGLLSGGQKQMLAIGRALIEPADLLIVDEPSKGLAPAMVLRMLEAFQTVKATNTTVLLVEQNFHFAKTLGDHVAVMDQGRIVYRGAMAELADDSSLQQRLLGLSLESHQ